MPLTALLVLPGSDIMGRIICVAEHDDVCHVAVDLGDGWVVAEECVGCWGRPLEEYSNAGIIRYQLPLTDKQEKIATAWLRAQVGKRYAWAQIGLDAANLLFHARLGDKDGRYVCSSLVAEACKVAGHDLFPGVDPLAVTPADFHRLVLAATAPASAVPAP